MKPTPAVCALLLTATAALLPTTGLAPERTTVAAVSSADEWSELRARFESRDARLQELKRAGVAGETFQGFVEFVGGKSDADAARLVDEENTDRRRLYSLIAQRDGVTADAVADRAARRNFTRARTGEFLKYPDGRWVVK